MRWSTRRGALAAGLILVACGGGSKTSGNNQPPPPPTKKPPPPVPPPVTLGDFTFWSTAQGLSPTVHDVSADEGGNVYVAGEDAVYAKSRTDTAFQKFTPDAAGLTRNCHDPQYIANPSPPDPLATCPIISVAGGAPGTAVIGFKGVGVDYDYDAPWALNSGGADLLAFDGKSLTRTRHVFLASPPGVICEHWVPGTNNSVCADGYVDSTWMSGRKKMRQVKHILVNHDQGRALSYGDVYFGATHGCLGVLVAHPDQRHWIDYTKGDPTWAETTGVWEHEHPAKSWPDGRFLTGESMGLALDPTTNVPWFANQFFTTSMPDIAGTDHPTWNGWWGDMTPFLAFWEPDGNPDDASLRDNVSGLSFCADGSLWVSSFNHGVGRYDPSTGAWTGYPTPGNLGNDASAIACDPSDNSIWVGFGYGGFGRLRNGQWDAQSFVPAGAPGFATNPVTSIQIDRWATPRIVYMAHEPSAKFGPGGVTAYSGP